MFNLTAAGPVPVAISKYAGVRRVVVAGGLLSCMGFVLASKTDHLLLLAAAMVGLAGKRQTGLIYDLDLGQCKFAYDKCCYELA